MCTKNKNYVYTYYIHKNLFYLRRGKKPKKNRMLNYTEKQLEKGFSFVFNLTIFLLVLLAILYCIDIVFFFAGVDTQKLFLTAGVFQQDVREL